MKPTKENAELALKKLEDWPDSAPAGGGTGEESKAFVKEFIEAAKKKLPTEKAITDDNARKRAANAAKAGFETINTDAEKYPK